MCLLVWTSVLTLVKFRVSPASWMDGWCVLWYNCRCLPAHLGSRHRILARTSSRVNGSGEGLTWFVVCVSGFVVPLRPPSQENAFYIVESLETRLCDWYRGVVLEQVGECIWRKGGRRMSRGEGEIFVCVCVSLWMETSERTRGRTHVMVCISSINGMGFKK